MARRTHCVEFHQIRCNLWISLEELKSDGRLKDFDNYLKDFVSNPYTIQEKKGVDKEYLRNYSTCLLFSNELNIVKCSIMEVEIKPVYRIGEKSKMKIIKVIPKISWLLIKGFFKRLWLRYLIHDFHPLFLLYNMAFILNILWLPYLYKIFRAFISGANLSFETLFAFTFLGVFGFQSLLFAMWMDVQDNERLYK